MKLGVTTRPMIRFILLAALASYLFGCTSAPISSQDDAAGSTPTEAKLLQAYKTMNERYFFNLPVSKTGISLLDLSKENEMGRITQRYDGTWLIEIDTKTNPTEKQAEMTLVHESCHQEDTVQGKNEGLDGHGEAFQTCMLNKAQDGIFKDLW
jgi:hypothetical protein